MSHMLVFNCGNVVFNKRSVSLWGTQLDLELRDVCVWCVYTCVCVCVFVCVCVCLSVCLIKRLMHRGQMIPQR